MADEANEVWQPIPGLDAYEASTDGRIRRAIGGQGARAGHVLTPQSTSDGYLRVGLYVNGKRQGRSVHRLVALAFLGPPPSALHQVNHKDTDKTRNAPSNLEWVTCQENVVHAAAAGLRSSRRGQANGRAKLAPPLVLAARSMLEDGATYQEVAARFGISKSQVWNVKSGRQWSGVS